jgi:hypothetical protein
MSTDYKTITDHIIDMFDAAKSTSLSMDMTQTVKAIKIGQYVPESSTGKAIIYIRPETPALIGDMAGGLSRQNKILYLFSGSVSASDRDTAWDDVQCLYNNIENLLMHHPTESGYWSGSHFGFQEGDDSSPEEYGQFGADSGTDIIAVHFWLRWSIFVRINRE